MEVVKEDFQIYLATMVIGYTALFGPYTTGMHEDGTAADHDLWLLLREVLPRMGAL